MSQVYLGQIVQGGWNFAPRGFHVCDGSLLAISQYTAVFSLLGTQFGGNGTSTFGLPDFRGRVAVGTGNGPGLTPYVIGQSTGTESVAVTVSNMPSHTHTATFASTSTLSVSGAKANAQVPPSNGTDMLAKSTEATTTPFIYGPTTTTGTITLGGLNVAGTVTNGMTGGSVPLPILQPLLAVTVVIALEGIFPSRN